MNCGLIFNGYSLNTNIIKININNLYVLFYVLSVRKNLIYKHWRLHHFITIMFSFQNTRLFAFTCGNSENFPTKSLPINITTRIRMRLVAENILLAVFLGDKFGKVFSLYVTILFSIISSKIDSEIYRTRKRTLNHIPGIFTMKIHTDDILGITDYSY